MIVDEHKKKPKKKKKKEVIIKNKLNFTSFLFTNMEKVITFFKYNKFLICALFR